MKQQLLSDYIPFEKRFQRGKIHSITDDLIQLELLTPPFMRRVARVQGNMSLNESHSLKKGSEVAVFITGASYKDTTRGAPSLFYASILWADRSKNPWIISPPKIGEVFTGKAIQYTKTSSGVIIELSSGIKGLLLTDDTPEYINNINELIDLGDKLVVAIKSVDKNSLRVYLSINYALEKLSKVENDKRLSSFNTELIQLTPRQDYQKKLPDNSPVREVGVLGFDHYFTEHLTSWLNLYGYQTNHIRDINHLRVVTLPANAPTHLILCSSPFKHNDITENIQLLEGLRKKGIHMQWIAEPGHQPLILMPALPSISMHLNDVLGLLENNNDCEDYTDKEYFQSKAFHFDAYQEERVGKLASHLLENICSENKFLAALWVIRERSGVYAVRASHNIDEDKITNIRFKLNQTFIASSIESNEERTVELFRAGELQTIAPKGARNLWVLPIPFSSFNDPPETHRAVAFFAPRHVENTVRYHVKDHYLAVMQAYVETLFFARHNESLTAFARIGTNTVSLMHEIARQTNSIKDLVESIHLQKEPCSHNNISKLYKNVKELDKLSHGNMRDIMKSSSSFSSIKEIVISLTDDFKHRATAQGTEFDASLPDYPLRISLPRLPVSHAIRNLLDNAFYYVEPLKKQGYIHIKVSVDNNRNNETPLWVDIIDNGSGVRASMKSSLFKPRHSAKNIEGVGMGLHISQGLVRNIGGELSLEESIRWKKTRFRIALPIILTKE